MRARYAVIAVVAVALVAGSAALAGGFGQRGIAGHGTGQGLMAGPGMGDGPGMLGLGLQFRGLDLTQEQRDAIHAIVVEEQPELQALRDKLDEGQKAFDAAHPPTDFDEAAIRAHLAAQAEIMADIAVATARVRAKALGVLTDEQRTQLQELRTERQERMEQMRSNRQGRMGRGLHRRSN